MQRPLLTLLWLGMVNVAFTQAVDPTNYRTIDGTHNNPDHPEWGAVGQLLLRVAPAAYADSISAPAGPDRPNPRTISNSLFAQEGLINDPLVLSDFCWVWGQFLDHDLGITPDGSEDATIAVPKGDPHFDPLGEGRAVIPMHRNLFDPATGTGPDNPRQHPNLITAFIDGSVVYGSDEERAAWLRSFQGGKLKTSAGNMLPFNTVTGEYDAGVDPLAPHMDNPTRISDKFYVAGDVRANENPLLLSFHTIFVREHNRQCVLLAKKHPDWTDEQLYQYARKIVGGLIQSVVYDEWLPALGVELPDYTGYKPDVNPQLANEFTGAAFRLGHTLLNGNLQRLDENGQVIALGHIGLRDAFFNPYVVTETGGIEPFLRGMAAQTQQQLDPKVIDDVRNFLFGRPGQGGLDLVSINISRGRERGLADFNSLREAYGLPRLRFMQQVNPSAAVFTRLLSLYTSIDNIDPWVGLLAERPMEGALFGETIMAMMKHHFTNLRDGDRFFYLNDPVLKAADKDKIRRTTLRDIIMYNTGIKLMQDNVFRSMSPQEICGHMTLGIQGLVQTPDGRPVPAVDLALEQNGDLLSLVNDNNGFFDFGPLPACKLDILSPTRIDDFTNGVSTLDLVILMKHIQTVEPLTSPYQWIAGDVDRSGTITTLDLIKIRKLILNIDTAFAGNTAWRFVPADYEFVDPTRPLNEDFPEYLDFNVIHSSQYNQGFIAMKTGDVNNSVELEDDQLQTIAPRELAAGMLLQLEDRVLRAGEEIEITLHGDPLTQLAGFQFDLTFDGLVLLDYQSPLGEGYAKATPARLAMSWNDAQALQSKTGLLTLRLRAQRAGRLSDLLQLGQRLRPEAYDKSAQVYGLQLAFQPTELASSLVVQPIRPNPFSDQTVLPFRLPSDEFVTLRVFDATGRQVYQGQEMLPAGAHELTIRRDELRSATAGYLYYRLETATDAVSGKMIVIE